MDNNFPNNKEDKNNNNEDNSNIYQMLINKLNQNQNKNSNTYQINNNMINEQNEEEYEYEEESMKEPIEEKNFSQQVDFLYHPNDPEGQSSIKNILIKQYKKHKKLLPEKDLQKNKKSIKKVGSKKRDIIPFKNKNKGLFDPYLTQKELDYESNIKKQREERQKKIDEYEKNIRKKSRQKLEKDLNKKIINFAEPKGKPLIKAKNYANKKVKKDDEDLVKHFLNIPKPHIKPKIAKNLGFNPKKYDVIINSLLKEINNIKIERKKENEMFKKQIQLYANDNVDKYNNYYEFIYKTQKLNYDNTRMNQPKNIYNKNKPTRGQAINNLMKKYFDDDDPKNKLKKVSDINIINGINPKTDTSIKYKNKDKEKSDYENKVKTNNYVNASPTKKNNKKDLNGLIDSDINFENIDKLLSAENLTFQDKINILTELNKELDNYSEKIPIIVEQVKNSLDQLYEDESDTRGSNFRKEANKIPFVAMASRAAYQIIQSNYDEIIEKMIDELLCDCVDDLNIINHRKEQQMKKQNLIANFQLLQDNIEQIKKNEETIRERSNGLVIKNNNNNNNDLNKNRKKIIITKFRAQLNNDLINRNNNYRKDFKDYMVFKGSFYKDNIFDIYDEYIEEEGENILNKAIDKYINDLHKFGGDLAKNEINNLVGE